METYTQFYGRLNPDRLIYIDFTIEILERLMKFDGTQWFIHMIPYKEYNYLLFDNHFNIYDMIKDYDFVYIGYFNEEKHLVGMLGPPRPLYQDFKPRPSLYKLTDRLINIVKLITSEYNMDEYIRMILSKI
jgi:hypothetical protein